ncbi:hypothetical protein LPJ70_004490 [Coemansia sp. RSA 2708]|nr:hypothetical protein LPJ70_004490 [Coemansia sp. RSA 2708]KAJ2312290.1 hypothetical protein IWW54_002177 [Coemansia sp. RSA 2705]KAJ2737574.1 hypothetical protein H4R23_001740 [Coemansia sp. Cherry 401B]
MSTDKEVELKAKMAKGLEFKEAGGVEFKAGNFEKALRQYHYALLHLRGLNDNPMAVAKSRDPENLKESDITELEKELSTINSNMALCQLRLGRLNQITRCANAALKANPFNKKAKFRLVQGLVREGAIIKATKLLEELEKDSPNDPAFAAERRQIEKKEKQSDDKQRKEFGGMFDRTKN